MMALSEILAERLVLRAIDPAFAQDIYQAVVESWDDLAKWQIWTLNNFADLSITDYKLFCAKKKELFMAQQSFSFAIFSQSNQSFLGVCSLQSVGDEPKRFSLGFWLRSSAHGQGYATEAGRTLIDFAFKTLGVKQIYAHHAAKNRASQRVLERLGFSLYEIKPKAHKLYDDYVDEYRYTLSDIAALHR